MVLYQPGLVTACTLQPPRSNLQCPVLLVTGCVQLRCECTTGGVGGVGCGEVWVGGFTHDALFGAGSPGLLCAGLVDKKSRNMNSLRGSLSTMACHSLHLTHSHQGATCSALCCWLPAVVN